ncbi:MAG: Nramp family divalent metal transporter [Proteobacteria bacterium]|nr:Nramp family divalent metal transporter [Pseudomonadota bacterium]
MSETVASLDTISAGAVRAARETLAGKRRGLRGFLPFAGPAVIASVAYVDPGNFATNIQGGAQFGYLLLWVVVLANALAMLFQAMSAKLGIVTGQSLPQLCRTHFPRPLVIAMWLASEVAAMATDLAETLGAAIGLSLLFGLNLVTGLLITFAVTYAILLLQGRGFRTIEVVIGAFVAVIGLCYVAQLAMAPPDWGAFLFHSAVPQLAGPESVVLAVGVVGATVMPHAIYLHSSLVQNRIPAANEAETRRILAFSNREVVIALGVAGLVNMAMMAVAAAVFHVGHADVASIETAYHTLVPLLGAAAGVVFMVALLASGLSSSVVGTMAGQVIMQDFVGFRIPLWVRRLATMLPALAVVAAGVAPTDALVISQVVLSLVLPVPMIALVVLAGRADVMGRFANRRRVQAAAIAATAVVLGLNIVLLLQTAGVPIPLLGNG